MTTSSATLALDFPHPSLLAARAIAARLAVGLPVDRAQLLADMASAHGTGAASGRWTSRDAYDALELAQVLALRAAPPASDAPTALADLIRQVDALPTHSVRSEAQIAFQQFSTPMPIGFLAARLLRPVAGETVLEPSAGTGLLAIFAELAGAHLRLNERDPGRRALLQEAFPDLHVTGHDAEILGDHLPGVFPTAVLINPPFSRSEGRGRDGYAALRHLRAALAMLSPRGRCVAILPDHIGPRAPGWDVATAGCHQAAAFALPKGSYAKHGTGQPVTLIKFVKAPGNHAERIACRDLADLYDHIEALDAAPAPRAPALAMTQGALVGRSSVRPKLSPPRSVAASVEARPLDYAVAAEPSAIGAATGLYLPYRPSRITIADASPHPTPLVESIAMGSIPLPAPAYRPLLPTRLLDARLLSDAQLETIIYAGDAYERDLAGRFQAADEGATLTVNAEGAAYRMGFFLGDGTGAGKGRQVAGVLLDRWLRGARRHVWISKTENLLQDARRDWTAVGGLALDIQHLNQWTLGQPIAATEGIIFLTYATLRSNRGEKGTRLRQLLDWLGPDFDGVIVFDEAHEMAGVAGGEGRFGATKGSEQGLAGVRLQNLLPRARILYVSATGASDVNNLAYATRLGLWGPGTAFDDRRAFVEGLRRGGIAAMELVARDLKAQGLYAARALSFAGVEYDILEHALGDEQIAIYDAYADAWGIIHRNLRAALDATRVTDSFSKQTYNGGAKGAALSVFESTKQRFFAQLLISLKLPALIPAIKADLGRGDAVVIQLVSTAEAMLDRALAGLSAEERAHLDIELSPREFLIDYLKGAFPTRQMRVFTDDGGNERSEPMTDEDGQPVISAEAVAMRDAMLEELCALPVVGSALDHIIQHFGPDAVAEVTGRTRRIIEDAHGRQRVEARSSRSNLAETDAFMAGAKRILIFSDAGGTGRSYHASLDCPHQARRIHYLLEPGWRADAAIQGLGRTHRTHQATAPLFRPVSTDCRGERRFISTIARRLDSLGALTRGQRQTGGQGLFDPRDNLESDYALDSLVTWFRLLFAGKLRSIGFADFQRLTGLDLEGEGGGLVEDLPPIQRWLNRILALRIALQNAIFDEYLGLIEARVEAAREAGTLDIGVETIVAERISILERIPIRRDPVSGAVTEILRLETEQRVRPLTLDRVLAFHGDGGRRMINPRSGKSAMCVPTHSLTDDEGRTVRRFELIRPARVDRHRADLFGETFWEECDDATFAAGWAQEVEALRTRTKTEIIYLVTGLLLPVWGKLPADHVQVWRLTTDDGESLLGRLVPATHIAKLAEAFGAHARIAVPTNDIVDHVRSTGVTMTVGAYRLKRSLVAGEQRLELLDWPAAQLAMLKAAGGFTEIIGHRTRLFLPPADAAAILDRLGVAA